MGCGIKISFPGLHNDVTDHLVIWMRTVTATLFTYLNMELSAVLIYLHEEGQPSLIPLHGSTEVFFSPSRNSTFVSFFGPDFFRCARTFLFLLALFMTTTRSDRYDERAD